jgi:replicative DNA helicase
MSETPSVKERTMKSTKEMLTGYLDLLEMRCDGEPHYVDSCFSDLDEAFPAWLHDGHLIVVAARPAMGKTSLVQQIAEHVAQTKTVLFYTLEMSNYELIERSVSRRSEISVGSLKTGKLADDDWPMLTKAVNDLVNISFYSDDGVYDVDAIFNKSSSVQKKINSTIENKQDTLLDNDVVVVNKSIKPLGLIVVDYLQLASSSNSANRTLEISDISMKLKRLAKALQVPVIAVAQLNRGVESRQDKRPILSDLRESGQIEQDADIIMFVYRDEVYNPDTHDKGIAEIICSKNRHGATGTIRLSWIGRRMMFGGLLQMSDCVVKKIQESDFFGD